ncbi:MAG: HsdR family type I site-specific deoxyribonuclease, partial [Peptostreptococcaceae bacterium]
MLEYELEDASIEIFEELGYEYISGKELVPNSLERDTFKDVILKNRVKDALYSLNRDLPNDAIESVYRQIISFNTPILEENNEYFHNLMVNGIDVSFIENGINRTKKAYIIDFDKIENNNFIVVNQLRIYGIEEKRPDIVIFINGIPLSVIELKSIRNEDVGIEDAYNQIQNYKVYIEKLFYYNAFCVLSDGVNAKIGTITSNIERFMNWRTIDGENIEPLNIPQYETLIKGVFKKENFLDLIKNFLLFQTKKTIRVDEETGEIIETSSPIKILSGYHQYFAVKKAIQKTHMAINKDKKIGVVWHTQGSGKSFSMVFYVAKLIKEFNNPTIIILTDRNDLDEQLFSTFSQSINLLGQEPKRASKRQLTEEDKMKDTNKAINGLFDLLKDRESGGIIFTTIQKFKPENGDMPVLSNRDNIIVVADEAHRSQYGLGVKTTSKNNDLDLKYGYAKYLRDALPNASYIGFTGTPIEFEDKSTLAVFGDYIDIYDMSRAVEDNATVKI